MRRISFTDITLRSLKHSTQYVTYWDKALPSFGVRVGLLKKTFVLVRGKSRKRVSLGNYPAVALKTARAKALSIIDGTHVVLASQDPKARILEYVRQLHAGARWKAEQERLLTKHLLPKTANLATTTKKDILTITDSLSETPSEQLHAHRAFKAFFNWCQARDYVSVSPMTGLPMPTSQKTRDRVLTNEELRKIWHASKEYRQFGLVIRACILLGTRRGETSELQKEWIGASSLTIPTSATKNGREHLLPLSSTAKSIVLEITKSPRPNWNSWNKLKQTFDEKTGLSDWTIHDLRRTFSTLLAQLGTQPHIIERLLNHASGEISGVSAIYNRHKYLPEMREALQRYETHLATIVKEKLN